MMGIICKLIGHRRSARLARPCGEYNWESACVLCGVRLRRVRKGDWRELRSQEPSKQDTSRL